MTGLAHGVGGVHDVVLMVGMFAGPMVLLALVLLVGKLRGDDGDELDEEA